MIVFVNPDVCVVAKWYYVSIVISSVSFLVLNYCVLGH